MLIIRKEQLRVLGQSMQRNFEIRMLKHLRGTFGADLAYRKDEEVLDVVRQGIRRSATYGIILESDVARYIEYMFLYAPDFDSDPEWEWAGTILRIRDADGTYKMKCLDDRDQFLKRYRQ